MCQLLCYINLKLFKIFRCVGDAFITQCLDLHTDTQEYLKKF
jgi:hypothetical protein